MPAVFTLTLNPVVDVHFPLVTLEAGRENHTGRRIITAGGKGVNVSKALYRRGFVAPAYFLLGEEDGDRYVSLLERELSAFRYVSVPGPVREYISLNCGSGGSETRICYDGFRAGNDAVSGIFGMLEKTAAPGDIVCISGRSPDGADPAFAASLAARLKKAGVRIVCDTASFGPDELAICGPWLIKPNLAEARTLLGKTASEAGSLDLSAAAEALLKLSANVLISLGGEGVFFASRGDCRLRLPAVPVEKCYSSVGAGDNLLAGFLYSLLSSHYFTSADDGPDPIPEEPARRALETGLAFAAEICSEKR